MFLIPNASKGLCRCSVGAAFFLLCLQLWFDWFAAALRALNFPVHVFSNRWFCACVNCCPKGVHRSILPATKLSLRTKVVWRITSWFTTCFQDNLCVGWYDACCAEVQEGRQWQKIIVEALVFCVAGYPDSTQVCNGPLHCQTSLKTRSYIL